MFSRTAAQYLLAGFGEVFTLEAKDLAEVEANRKAIERLRDIYTQRARQFVSENAPLCEMLAQRISEREYLGCEELVEFDWSVTPPEGNWPLRWPEGVVLYKRDPTP